MIYTVETRFDFRNNQNQELLNYLNQYIIDYNKIKRYVFLYYISHNNISRSKFISQTAFKYGVLSRTINSIVNKVEGDIKAYKELKKFELENLQNKIKSYEKKVTDKEKQVKKLKIKANENKIKPDELDKLHLQKQALFQMKCKLNKLNQKLINKELNLNNISMMYGTKSYFKKQYNLKENNLTFAKWKNNFKKKRDSNIYLLGGATYKQGNDIAQLYYNKTTNDFTLKLFIDKPYRISNKDKFIVIEHLNFKNMHNELRDICINNENNVDKQALTFNIHRVGNKWYLQVMFELKNRPITTNKENGVVGLDYNETFIQVSETDSKGNLVNTFSIPIGKTNSNKNKTLLQQQLYELTKYAKTRDKPIACEDLNFKSTKSKLVPARSKKGKKYNKMISSLAYSDFKQCLNNVAYKNGVEIYKVNPRNTSKVGKEKYNKSKKLTTHQSAAYVIARSAMGFKDKAIINNKLVRVY